jgi:threonine dehydrogenase-like Zn-dependent dehydrogenase
VLRPGARYPEQETGIASAWGGFAQYGLVTDGRAFLADHPHERIGGQTSAQQIVPEEIDPAEATALITLKETLSASRAAALNESTRTAIVGTGPVARSFTFWAHWLQVPVLVVYGRRERWCNDFIELGANNYVAGDKPCVRDESDSTVPGTFDRAIEAVGSTAALEKALSLISPDGWVANYGVRHEDDSETERIREASDAERLVRLPVHEEDVHEEVLELVDDGTVVLADWITHRLPLEGIHEGFRLLAHKEALKVVIEL